ncbi:MAG TPA: DNA polymerase III subunit delta [Thermopetrobacter sp.]|nr:DNA polymerase III subunit delta [Thermopetrobacter sp.]
MAVFKPAERGRLLQRVRAGDLRGVLVYGSDVGGVGELAQEIIGAALGGEADDLALVTLEEETLAEDPARLADETQAISMFGGRRVVQVRNAGERFARAMEAVLDLPAGDTLVVARAGALRPGSRLRTLFEKGAGLAAAPVYEDSARDIRQVIRETLRRDGLEIEADALALLAERLGADRAATRSELEKLALYRLGCGSVRLEDVRAVCGDVSAHAMTDMLDAYFAGDYGRGSQLLSALLAEGTAAAAMLAAAARHVQQLGPMARAVAAGETPQRVVKSARPPIFFKRQEAVIRQLAAWSPAALEKAGESILEATALSRRLPQLDAAIAERCLLSISVQARRRR